MLAVVDYGVGNLFSLTSSLKSVGAEVAVTRSPRDLEAAGGVVLPGVGAFGDAAEKLAATGLAPVLKKLAGEGKPLLGICLGMQLLFDAGYEFGKHEGLGLVPGEVVALEPPRGLKVPHMGWNSLKLIRDCPLLRYTPDGAYVYYVHSFHAVGCLPYTAAVSDYGLDVTGVVANGNVFGTQFHPEKSGEVGLNMLKAFSELAGG